VLLAATSASLRSGSALPRPPRRALAAMRRGSGDGRAAAAARKEEEDDDEAPPWRDPRVVAVCGSTLCMMLGHGVAAPCVPLLSSHLGASAGDVGFALSTFGFARLALNVPVGVAADRLGRKPLLVGGALVNAAGHALSALAPDAASFALARCVAGAGNAAYLGTAAVYLSDVSRPGARARVLGLNHAALLAGVSLGPVLGGFVAGEASLQAPFFAVAALGVCSAAAAALAVTESRSAAATVAVAAAAGTGDAPSMRSLVFGDRRFLAAGVAHAATFALRQGGRNLLLALVAADVFGYSPLELGQLFGAMALGDLLGVAPASVLADAVDDARRIVVPSLIGTAAAVGALAGVVAAAAGGGDAAAYHGAFLGAVALWSLSTAALGPTLPAYAASLVPDASRGLGLAAFRSCGDVGFVLAPLALGFLADAFGALAALGGLSAATAAAAGAFAAGARPAAAAIPAPRRGPKRD